MEKETYTKNGKQYTATHKTIEATEDHFKHKIKIKEATNE